LKNVIVTCCVSRKQFEIPTGHLDPDIVEGLIEGQIAYLSQEARDEGWAWMFELGEGGMLEYRAVREVGGDMLVRHLRWFLNPADPKDHRMRT
jgi:hypothetical protein